MKGPPAGKERETEMTANEEKELQEDRELLAILRKHLKVVSTSYGSCDSFLNVDRIVAFNPYPHDSEEADCDFSDFSGFDDNVGDVHFVDGFSRDFVVVRNWLDRGQESAC